MIKAYMLRCDVPESNGDYIETLRLIEGPDLVPGQQVELVNDWTGFRWTVFLVVSADLPEDRAKTHRVWQVA